MDTSLPALDEQIVGDIARRAIGNTAADIAGWEVDHLNYDRTNPSSSGVYRVTGAALCDGEPLRWSAILKVLQSPAGMVMPNGAVIPRDLPEDPGLFGYWKREALAYEVGILSDLPGGMAAPRCYGVSAPTDSTRWLWQEELVGSETRWDLTQYRQAAWYLGRFNGAYLAGLPLPARPWLAGGWLRSWLSVVAAGMMAVIERTRSWEHPAVKRAVAPSLPGRIRRLWVARETLLTALEGMPQVLCHRDAFRPNLVLRSAREGTGEIVAIDWAFSGAGPVGEEIAPLIAMQPAGGKEGFAPWHLEEPVFEAYVKGLDDAGWRGDPLVVRFGYAASATLRYVPPTVAELVLDLCDERRQAEVERRRGMAFERVVEQQVALTEFLLDLADEATSLLGALRYDDIRRYAW